MGTWFSEALFLIHFFFQAGTVCKSSAYNATLKTRVILHLHVPSVCTLTTLNSISTQFVFNLHYCKCIES